MKDIHAGHKQRLREKAQNNIEMLSDHEVLELILNYTVVRSNMNPVAHRLIQMFGSLSNVLDADAKSLMQVDGVGKVSAEFLTLIPKILKCYKASKISNVDKISTIEDSINYFATILDDLPNEELYALCLDKNDKIITLLKLASGSLDTIVIEPKEIIRQLVKYSPHSVVLAHNHVMDKAYPSNNDIHFTKVLLDACNMVGINLVDHIIIAQRDSFSFRKYNILQF